MVCSGLSLDIASERFGLHMFRVVSLFEKKACKVTRSSINFNVSRCVCGPMVVAKLDRDVRITP